jgi:hypothetical protein
MTDMTDQKATGEKPAQTASGNPPAAGRRSKFGAAAEGWDAYNDWLERVRSQQGPISRQAVVAKALYSVSSYKTWAEKARDAFDKGK